MSASYPDRPLCELTVNLDAKRRPVKSSDRKPGPFPYYGAQGVVDYVHDYIFDGEYMLVAEDGENLRSRKEPIALLAKGKFWVNNHAHILKGNEFAYTRFLYYAINLANISGYVTGSTIPKLSQGSLNRIMVPCPSMVEQLEIVRLLGSLDDKIDLNRRVNETLEAMAQAIYRDWFVDFGPTRRKMEGATEPAKIMGGLVKDAERAQALADLFPGMVGNDGLPEGWRLGRLKDVAEVNMGASPKGDTYNEDGIGVPLANGPVEFGDYFLVPKKWTTAPTRLSQTGDYVICVRGSTTGRHVFADGVYCLGRGVAAIRGLAGQQDFVNATINATLNLLLQKTTGSVFPNLSGEDIRDFACLVPPPALRYEYCAIATPLREFVWHNINENSTLTATRDLLLPKLMSGEIRLQEGEELLEAAQ